MINKKETIKFKKTFFYVLVILGPFMLLDAFFILAGRGDIKINGHPIQGKLGFIIELLLIPFFALGISFLIWFVSYLLRSPSSK
jgi:hypothetical protein